ncbi:hypothetical protein CK501_15890 [Halovibrio salipaludis]|uniref:Tetratricopeptide repeat protein n=1 Tax=Halovibrio salipaludis TaxID=2032626 RepID=A0A2A2ETH5_9GAMM|nr:hypothetical protein [Halovibrio salipaludis]PAU76416.1 hypothetical protein CK501_15890 [Halovibrio salipaludis]
MSRGRVSFMWVAVLVVPLMLGCSSSAAESPEELVEKARATGARASGNADFTEALKLTEQALEEDEAFVPAHNARINILLEMGRLDDVAAQAQRLYEVQPTPDNHLYWCMAKEAASDDDSGQKACYSDVVDSVEQSSETPATNANYVMALKLLESPKFDEVVERYIVEQESDAAREMARFQFIERDRETVINNLFRVSSSGS